MINRVRYRYISETVGKLLKDCNIDRLPVDLEKIQFIVNHIKKCKFIPFSLQMEKYHLTKEQVAVMAGSFDASCNYSTDTGKYLIFYNDVDEHIINSNRHRWNMAHEIGHMILDHNKLCHVVRLSRSTKPKAELEILELEADHFATLLLAHPILLSALNIVTPEDIKKHCLLSHRAALSVFNYYTIWNGFSSHYHSDKKVLNQFKNFLNTKTCVYCGHTFAYPHINYCPKCCCDILSDGDFNDVQSPLVLNEYFQLHGCLECGNTYIPYSDSYCSKCGEEIEFNEQPKSEPLWLKYKSGYY
ncbi:MAG: hypothetical protein K0R69_2786 [Clostridia bacterium]|nr:hypothetical protein [Clostridia bacterium]